MSDDMAIGIEWKEVSPIDNKNLESGDVILLDISCNKKWISYVTCRKENKIKVFEITRRIFSDIPFKERSYIEEENKVSIAHRSLDISGLINPGGLNHCKFLSISPDGKYVVLSFYEKKTNKTEHNKNCLIFEMKGDKFTLFSKDLEFSGRAVFLNKKNYSLALINKETVKVYNSFPDIKSESYLFDLNRFLKGDKQQTHEMFQIDTEYINSASWASIVKTEKESNDLGNQLQKIETVMQLTRHIRHNVLTTQFAGGIARVWSIEDGIRLTSFSASEENIIAFSKNYKYAATFVDKTRSVKIYNVKSGLLVYHLKTRPSNATTFKVSHIRFCYDSRYLALSGIENQKKSGIENQKMIVFEVWYIEAEKSIYKENFSIAEDPDSFKIPQVKFLQPFVMASNNEYKKCLVGVYTFFNSDETTSTKTIELEIDKIETDGFKIDWIKSGGFFCGYEKEIHSNLNNHQGLKCGRITIKKKEYLIRFGKHTVQLWHLSDYNSPVDSPISNDDELIYIRAYKGPDYGISYSFRQDWKVFEIESVLHVGGFFPGRVLVNITENTNGDEIKNPSYHTEELFLPLEELNTIVDEPRKFDYHELESACQALHYLTKSYKNDPAKDKRNLEMILEKTKKLIHSAVENIDLHSNFFSTIAGSKTLAMLASFEDGREIIKLIISKPIPISIFSYTRSISKTKHIATEEEEFWKKLNWTKLFKKNNTSSNNEHHQLDEISTPLRVPDQNSNLLEEINNANQNENGATSQINRNTITYRSSHTNYIPFEKNHSQSIAANENVLTVLIDELNYDLYKLLFNRILSDSKELGPGCLPALTDVLLYLQEEGNSDLLLKTSKKLSFLEIDITKLGILASELDQELKIKSSQKEYISNMRYLESHATMENIKKYDGYRLFIHKRIISMHIDKAVEIIIFIWNIIVKYPYKKFIKTSRKTPRGMARVCVVPLPHFNTYNDLPEDQPKNITPRSNNNGIIKYNKRSAFIKVAIDQNTNNIFHQGDTVLEVMLQYKWERFVRWRFYCICLIHVVYYVSYSTGVLFAENMYNYVVGSKEVKEPGHIVSLIFMCAAALALIFQEGRQLCKTSSFLEYFSSGYNWIDIVAYIFPLCTLFILIFGGNYFTELCGFSTLVLWAHGILRLRVISYVGVTIETIIQLCKKIFFAFIIMFLVICAFTNTYIVLLNHQPDEYFRENYIGTFADSTDDTLTGNTSLVDVSASNAFTDVFKAFSQVWFFVYGIWDPLNDGDIGDDKLIMCVSILFSLVTVLIFTNLLIALMSTTAEEVNSKGKSVWVSHFAAVVSEIENLWCLERARRNRKNNPTFIYYLAPASSVTKREDELKNETNMLSEKLKIKISSPLCTDCGCHK